MSLPSHYLARTSGERALEYAVLLSQRLRAGLDVDSIEEGGSGTTLLHAAAAAGNLCVAKVCLSHGAKVNVINSAGDMPLHLAVARGHSLLVHALLRAGADRNARNHMGETAIEVAQSSTGVLHDNEVAELTNILGLNGVAAAPPMPRVEQIAAASSLRAKAVEFVPSADRAAFDLSQRLGVGCREVAGVRRKRRVEEVEPTDEEFSWMEAHVSQAQTGDAKRRRHNVVAHGFELTEDEQAWLEAEADQDDLAVVCAP